MLCVTLGHNYHRKELHHDDEGSFLPRRLLCVR